MSISPQARLRTLLEQLRSSYWFIPASMTVVAMAMGLLMPSVDEWLGVAWLEGVPWLYANKPDGARAVLSTIAGSMITVAGVTFSITIAAVAYASSQLGPRLLYNFMRDRGNQITLGTFIATFVYCLLILRTIRSGDHRSDLANDVAAAFVPHLAITIAVVFALLSVCVLIFFVHHVPDSIRTSTVVTEVGETLAAKVRSAFSGSMSADATPKRPNDQAALVCARGSGSLQYIDLSKLEEIAVANDLIIATDLLAGDFVVRGQPLARVWSEGAAATSNELAIAGAFVWGAHRTQTQDIRFVANELVEIAARALSPGVNDPFSAIHCIDWLSSGIEPALGAFADSGVRLDEEHNARVYYEVVDGETLIDCSFGRLRHYAAGDANVAAHMIYTLAKLAAMTTYVPLKRQLHSCASSVVAEAEFQLNPVSVKKVEEAWTRALSGRGFISDTEMTPPSEPDPS